MKPSFTVWLLPALRDGAAASRSPLSHTQLFHYVGLLNQRRHSKGEASFFRGRCDRERALMRARDLGSDVKAKPESLFSGLWSGPRKGLKQPLLNIGFQRLAAVGDRELEAGSIAMRPNGHW